MKSLEGSFVEILLAERFRLEDLLRLITELIDLYSIPGYEQPVVDRRKGRPALDMTGRRYGALLVISRGTVGHGRHQRWLCRCDCGIEKEIRGDALRNGYHQSCGCGRVAATGRRAAHMGRAEDGRFLPPVKDSA